MESLPWIIIAVGALLILLIVAFIVLLFNKKIPHREPDYQTWFWLGICWLGAGIPLGTTSNNWGISFMGLVFMILGLANKNKWKKNHVKWKDLKPLEKKFKTWIIVVLGIIVLAGLVAFFIVEML